ncbi:nuclear transport factor 2 family protein [Roseiterribacter gracilis]|uniref:nuclear transport factor 2 family protein n=1 Tax=Roseiterribacter gracilis TaxID=2812848 RepID=UPI003B4320F9
MVLNTKTGERGTIAAWVDLFAQVWQQPKERLDRMLALLDEQVALESPMQRVVGRAAARQDYLRILRALPDLTGVLNSWEHRNGYLFIDMSLEASIGGRMVKWPSIDRIRFRDGIAVERVAYYDPQPVHRAFMRNPKGWSQYARLQAGV